MNASPEQTQIVRTVINEFLPVAESPVSANKIIGIILKYVEGKADQANSRHEVRDALAEVNQQADEERVDLCIETANSLAQGYFHWTQGQENPDELDFYPALELSQVYQRDETVDWNQKWRQSGGRMFSGNRMIALKNDQIWSQISAFCLPFPPFDLDSGMDVSIVSRDEAVELGLLTPNERVEPGLVDFNFGQALRSRVEFYFGVEGRRQRFEKEVEKADVRALLQMAEASMDSEGDSDDPAVRDAIFILERAIKQGFQGNREDQAKAYGLLSEAYELMHQTEQAISYRSKQLETFQAWIDDGIPTDGNQRARVYSQITQIYLQIGQPDQAAHYQQLADDSRTGYSLFFDARQCVQNARGMNIELATEIVPKLEQSIKRGFCNNLQDEVNAYALLVTAHDVLQDQDKANQCREGQLKALEAWIGKGIPIESDRCSKAYGQAADICEKIGAMEKAVAFRRLQDETRDGLSLLSEALGELKACNGKVQREVGAQILDCLTKAAERIPQMYQERHAEIFRATGEILEAWGDVAQAIEYYEFAIQKNPKVGIKRRLDNLRRNVNKVAESD